MKEQYLSRYEARGVSSSKKEVHAAVKNEDPGLFPGAFCKILPDYLSGSAKHCNIQHTDGAGTKAGLAYLAWKVLGWMDVWAGIVQDSIIMNVDDEMCVGSTGPFLVSQNISRNKALIPGQVIATLVTAQRKLCERLSNLGIPCYPSGGETADLGDLVRTIVVDNTITTRMARKDIIDASNIRPGSYIVGFSSTGKADWEHEEDSSMGSNGLTSARHDTLSPQYRKHTETYCPETPARLIYCGPYNLETPLPGKETMSVARALLSPTRTYTPLVKNILENFGRKYIQAFIHCSGSGQTKIGNFGPKGVIYVKDNLFSVPPLFRMLHGVRKLYWAEMYSTYNMGHRLEMVTPSWSFAKEVIALSKKLGIEARFVGTVEKYDKPDKRAVRIINEEARFDHIYEF